MDFTGRTAAFFDGSDLKLVYVAEAVGSKLQVRNETGRKFKIPSRNILTAFSAVSYEQFSVSCSGLLEKVTAGADEIETELLWEMADQVESSCDSLVETYFGESEAENVCSMFLALLKDTVHFKRKGILFTPRTEDQVEEQKTALRRKQEKEAFKERVIPWLISLRWKRTPRFNLPNYPIRAAPTASVFPMAKTALIAAHPVSLTRSCVCIAATASMAAGRIAVVAL